jgi:NAD(P)-dependent dehydrogenase (short-subunit alcohol dehydrogenase family)
VIAIDLEAVILGTRLAIKHFIKHRKPGVIINTASEAGLFPASPQPVYSAAKAGVVHFTRSLRYLARSDKIRVNAVCPGFVKTQLASGADKLFKIQKWIPIQHVVDAFVLCIRDADLAGDCIHVNTKKVYKVPFKQMQKAML